MSQDSPPPSFYEPPLLRHMDNSICQIDACQHPDCHQVHKDQGDFPSFCEACNDEKCSNCNGRGYLGTGKNEEECRICESTGRIKP